MAAHVASFADALGLKRVDVLGYSLGGMVAQEVALEWPNLGVRPRNHRKLIFYLAV